MLRKFYIILGIALLATAALRAQEPQVEVKSRIAGLEDNEEYMAWLREDVQLQNMELQVVKSVERVRQQLREDPAARQQYSQEILALENRIFEIRNTRGRLIDRINTVEQEWVLSNLNSPSQPSVAVSESATPTIPDSLKVRNLVYNRSFGEQLPAQDYAALLRAQGQELQAVDYVNRYFTNYTTLTELAAAYAAAATEAEALDIQGRYATVEGLNRVLADSLAEVWNAVFDNKSYAYGYLLDKMGREDILAREEERLAAAARELTALRGQTASDAVADYFLRKRVAVDYEIAVADVLALDAARDSLRSVLAQLQQVDYRLPRTGITERTFIQYDTLSFSTPSRYTYRNPIPECRVYARGTIYRVLLGTFNTKRAADLFRGAYPLCYLVNDEGKWVYFAGGFATLDQVEQAQKTLKSRGFLRPEIVVWNDGVYHNLTREPEAQKMAYRVEITGIEALPDAVKQAIVEAADGRELSRVGQQLFVVGLFDDRAVAERLAAAVAQTDAALQIKVAEITE